MEKFKLPESIIADRIVLLKREHDHDEDMWEAIEESRSDIRKYLFWVDKNNTFADIVSATDLFHKSWEDDQEWGFDIYDLTTHRFLGCIGVHNIKFADQNAELGYWLRSSETKKGYMTEAVLAIEKELFEHGMHRVTICCDANNKNSANTAKRAGYALESVAKEALYHRDGLHDIETYVKFSPYPIKNL